MQCLCLGPSPACKLYAGESQAQALGLISPPDTWHGCSSTRLLQTTLMAMGSQQTYTVPGYLGLLRKTCCNKREMGKTSKGSLCGQGFSQDQARGTPVISQRVPGARALVSGWYNSLQSPPKSSPPGVTVPTPEASDDKDLLGGSPDLYYFVDLLWSLDS